MGVGGREIEYGEIGENVLRKSILKNSTAYMTRDVYVCVCVWKRTIKCQKSSLKATLHIFSRQYKSRNKFEEIYCEKRVANTAIFIFAMIPTRYTRCFLHISYFLNTRMIRLTYLPSHKFSCLTARFIAIHEGSHVIRDKTNTCAHKHLKPSYRRVYRR